MSINNIIPDSIPTNKKPAEENSSNVAPNLRPSVANMDAILGQEIAVHDHGFIRVIDYMGNDDAVVQAARVSYGKGTKKVNEDRALIEYLMRHRHTTPFEMCELKLHIKMPIFVARQWVRHRTASINEYSARYSILDKEFYLPNLEYISAQSSNNKQCRDVNMQLSNDEAEKVLHFLKNDAETCYDHYLNMLNLHGEQSQTPLNPEHQGVARELARINLNLNYYTQIYWKIDLHNLLHFLKLRSDKHAQFEIRAYAEALLKIVSNWVPLTYSAFENYMLNSVNLSSKAIKMLKYILQNNKNEAKLLKAADFNLSQREFNEIMDIFEIDNAQII